ncbi:MAG: septum formation initiator family protein [Coriobacteriales bacterium]|jgi:cell division protein FtsB|nr:septum formation initiator family protein [Coriobacteriales bacterium]
MAAQAGKTGAKAPRRARIKAQGSAQAASRHASAKTRQPRAQSPRHGGSPARENQPNLNRLLIVSSIAICLLVAVMALYPALRDYYLALRSVEQLDAELSAVLNRNERIIAQITALNTVEGVEDRVREQFGWVKAGEEAVNITGLEITDSTTVLPTAVNTNDVALPSSWLTEFLDALFFIQSDTSPANVPDPFIDQ